MDTGLTKLQAFSAILIGLILVVVQVVLGEIASALGFVILSESAYVAEAAVLLIAVVTLVLSTLIWAVARWLQLDSSLGLARVRPVIFFYSMALGGLFQSCIGFLFDGNGDQLGNVTKVLASTFLVTFGVVTPLFEEIAFRGIIYSGLAGIGCPFLVNAGVGVGLWIALHQQPLGSDWGSLLLCGTACVTSRSRYGSIIPGYGFHSGWNLSVTAHLF